MKRTVVIAIPHHGQGCARFWQCLEVLRFYSLAHDIDTIRLTRKGPNLNHNRNLLVRDTLEKHPDASHLLWIDDDMTFSDDLLVRLLAHEKQIVVANAHRKQPPYIPVVSVLADDGELVPAYIPPKTGGLHRVSSAGTGVCLTTVDVYDAVGFPWFETHYSLPIKGARVDPAAMIKGHVLIGGDTQFFMRAGGAGINMYCDFSLEIGHIGDHEFTWRDYERNQGNN
ncbi:MAG: hypothetical protein HGJ93_00680 [Desulfosarcina sp.]|nr:hypothetical protein [Desulfosarcina sp.]MBC2764501.1 hypothetical protein [Desulfosarcina sp.]